LFQRPDSEKDDQQCASLYRGEELKGRCRKRCKEEKESTNIDNTTQDEKREMLHSPLHRRNHAGSILGDRLRRQQ
jgi:hypothetical protein